VGQNLDISLDFTALPNFFGFLERNLTISVFAKVVDRLALGYASSSSRKVEGRDRRRETATISSK